MFINGTSGPTLTGDLEGYLDRHYDYSGQGLTLKGEIPYAFLLINPYFAFERYELCERINLSFGRPPSLFTEIGEKLSAIYHDFGAGIQLVSTFKSGLCIRGYGAIYESRVFTDFQGNQALIRSTLPPVISVATEKKKHTSYKCKAGLEIGWQLDHFALSVVGDIEKWGFIPQILNPVFVPAVAHTGHARTVFGSVGLKASVPF